MSRLSERFAAANVSFGFFRRVDYLTAVEELAACLSKLSSTASARNDKPLAAALTDACLTAIEQCDRRLIHKQALDRAIREAQQALPRSRALELGRANRRRQVALSRQSHTDSDDGSNSLSEVTIAILPLDILEVIAACLPPQDLAACNQVSKLWAEAASSRLVEARVWAPAVQRALSMRSEELSHSDSEADCIGPCPETECSNTTPMVAIGPHQHQFRSAMRDVPGRRLIWTSRRVMTNQGPLWRDDSCHSCQVKEFCQKDCRRRMPRISKKMFPSAKAVADWVLASEELASSDSDSASDSTAASVDFRGSSRRHLSKFGRR